MIVLPPGGGEVVGDSPERRVEILCEHDAVHATWSRFAPGRDGADLHVHRLHTDVFYVLEGEGAGTWVTEPSEPVAGARFIAVTRR